MSGPLQLTADELDLERWILPGDGVVFGQACAEPTVLVNALLTQAQELGGVGEPFDLGLGLPVLEYRRPL